MKKAKIGTVGVLSEAAYYKLKARVLEIQAREVQLQQIAQAIQRQRELAYADAGLDQTKNYRLDDEKLIVTEITPEQV